MIFLYRGELHKVSGVTRQWPLPKPGISLSAFRQALEKRNDAVRRTSSVVPTSYLTRQDTCVSHNVSPAQQQLRSREDAETEIGREGRGESDGHANMDLEDSFLGEEDMEVRDDHEPLEDHKERKKRKREEAIEVSKSKLKVEVKEDVVAVKVEVKEEVAVKIEDEMELDHKVEDSPRAPSVEKDEGDPMAMDEAKSVPSQGDFVKVEAPSTPPVHSEEMNTLKPVSESSFSPAQHLLFIG